ncbi:Fe2OG dioxygenase domain-containing protein [Psidium guajava]|nr:Fe2OG dioxygenase domain-containing protein [Psidium guajava]
MATTTLLPKAARRLEGKVAVITDGVGGIGQSIARLFSKHGAKVIAADIHDNLGKSVCTGLGPETASFVHCDVLIESDIENAIATTVGKHGKLDIMVNNAAITDPPKANIWDNDKADFEKVISVNLTGVFLGTKHAARAMIPSRSGSIINVGSVSSSVGGVASHAYTSSKHVVVGLTRNVASELGRHGIRVNCVSPYLILTPSAREFFKIGEDAGARVYSDMDGVSLQEEDVAEAALY